MHAPAILSATAVLLTVTKAAPSVDLHRRQSAWNPPSNLTTALDQVWQHEMSTYSNPLGFKNYGYDQIFANGGKINYCVRWESTQKVSATLRTQIETAVARSFKKWIDTLVGFDGWPYADVPIKVVGWAAKDRSLFDFTDTSIDYYIGINDEGGIPQCDPRCGRFFHQDGNYNTCPGGASHHYDLSLWLTSGMTGGAGGDWGQRIGSEYMVSNVNTDNIHILLHEMGHTFALDDFYDWTPTGVTNFIMLAGSAMQITEFDKWMLRDWWRHLKSRYNLAGSGTTTTTTRTTTTTAKTTTLATSTTRTTSTTRSTSTSSNKTTSTTSRSTTTASTGGNCSQKWGQW
ncbi:hypothetical protein HDV00_009041 [Rhizophlyctis rosea]|nr:hypothetical protein HDV00_009041 [Rhizophlyctis rosea]